MVTASASGLDPDVSPDTAYAQVARVAAARHMATGVVKAMVDAAVQTPLGAVIGEPRVNVLLLNRQLDRVAVNRQPGRSGAKPAA